MNSGLPGLLLSLLVLLHVTTTPSDALSEKLERFISNLFNENQLKEEFESITTLSGAHYNKTRRLSLTQGGGNAESYKVHQSAMAMLNAVYRVQNSDLSESEKDEVMLAATIPQHYCPQHNYNYYRCDEEYPFRSMDGSCNNLYVFESNSFGIFFLEFLFKDLIRF